MGMDNKAVAVAWVDWNMSRSTKDHARSRNGNFSFAGASMYSYRTEIARFLNTPKGELYVICDTYRYSVTTVSKHYHAIYWARYSSNRHFRIISIEKPDYSVDNAIEGLVFQADRHLGNMIRARNLAKQYMYGNIARHAMETAQWLHEQYEGHP